MAIRKKPNRKPEIDLSGPEGNSFCLMGLAQSYGEQLGYSKDIMEAMIDDMQSGDYENILKVFDSHFGDYVDLVR